MRNIKICYILYLVTFYHMRFCNCLVLSILQCFAKKQVGSLPNPERTLSNAQVHTKFHCCGKWHLLEVITQEDLIITKDTIREVLLFHFIFVNNFIHNKNQLYGMLLNQFILIHTLHIIKSS